jgi:KDO2-lipid IV(A) lauroyltransferase
LFNKNLFLIVNKILRKEYKKNILFTYKEISGMSFYESEELKGHYFQKFIFKIVLFSAKWLTWKGAYRTGTFIGKMLYLFRVRFNVAIKNLDTVYGDTKTVEEKKKIYHDSMINLGRFFINYLRLPYMGEKFWNEKCKFTNEHVLKELLSRGKGVLCLFAHFGMWDLAGGKLGTSGYPIAIVGKRLKQPVLNKAVIDARISMNLGHIVTNKSMEDILNSLRRGESVVMALDQNRSRRNGIFIDWMGRKACSVRSDSYVVSQTGAAVITLHMLQHGPDEFEVVLGDEEILWESFPDAPEMEMHINTQKQSYAIQNVILEKPELWLWTHKRFK